MNSTGKATPVIRVHAMYEVGEDDGAGGSRHILVNYDRESPVSMTELSLGPRGSCVGGTSGLAVPVVRGSNAVT